MKTISQMDRAFYALARKHIDAHRTSVQLRGRVLDIGPEGDPPVCIELDADLMPEIRTLGLKDDCDIKADITKRTPIEDSTYDFVFCMEVLEHVVNPFAALEEIRRILKPGGLLLASAPYNFREHNPRPDCWRFGRNGWSVLLCEWDDVKMDVLMTPNRFLMPLHINVTARCNKTKSVDPRTLSFPPEEE